MQVHLVFVVLLILTVLFWIVGSKFLKSNPFNITSVKFIYFIPFVFTLFYLIYHNPTSGAIAALAFGILACILALMGSFKSGVSIQSASVSIAQATVNKVNDYPHILIAVILWLWENVGGGLFEYLCTNYQVACDASHSKWYSYIVMGIALLSMFKKKT